MEKTQKGEKARKRLDLEEKPGPSGPGSIPLQRRLTLLSRERERAARLTQEKTKEREERETMIGEAKQRILELTEMVER